VFAGFFHIYRYGLSQAKNVPPPPPILVPEEKPKELAEPQLVPKTSKISEGHPSDGGKNESKEIAQISTPKIQADLGIDTNRNYDLGSSDLKKL
jgi:ubiquinol-cytochrome c reductase cytochrome b subunit